MVQIENVSFGYRRGNPLFDQLELKLEAGRIYGLLGKNGAGKTTLIKQMGGLLFPKSGTIEVMGYRPERRFPSMLEEIFIIPEEFYLPPVSIQTYAEVNAPFYPNFDGSQFSRYLQEFKIETQLKLHHMSYGQKKKMLLAFALATNTRLLMLDEPTNGLDIPSKSQFRKIIAQSMHENRMMLISTHQVRDLSNLIDYVIILDNGKIIFEKDMHAIARKIAFKKIQETGAEDVLYKEETLGGYHAMVKNKTATDTEVDLELLFNGIITNVSTIQNEF